MNQPELLDFGAEGLANLENAEDWNNQTSFILNEPTSQGVVMTHDDIQALKQRQESKKYILIAQSV